MDGVYTVINGTGTPTRLQGTVQAAPNARPIITGSDGYAPYIEVQNGAMLDGIWFGNGTKQPADQPFVIKNDTTIRNCTLFGYYGGIVEGGGARNTIHGNRLVECGTGSLYHGIYISNGAADHWTLIENNLFIGGAGYAVQLWHEPSNCTIRRNFYGDNQWMLVVNGLGHTVRDEIMWSNRGVVGALLGCNYAGNPDDGLTSFDVQHVLTGAATQRTSCTMDANRICTNNTFYSGVPQTYGNNPHTVASVGGIDGTALNSAIASLRSAFVQSTAAIQADSTIEGLFATCAAAVTTWSAA